MRSKMPCNRWRTLARHLRRADDATEPSRYALASAPEKVADDPAAEDQQRRVDVLDEEDRGDDHRDDRGRWPEDHGLREHPGAGEHQPDGQRCEPTLHRFLPGRVLEAV